MLQQLGINETVFLQFIIYLAIFPLLYTLVSKPFAKAQEERQSRTKGTEQLSYEFQQKSAELQAEYQRRAREVNENIHQIFTRAKSEAQIEQDDIIQLSKREAQKTSDENSKKMAILMASANEELRGQASQLSMMVTQKLLGKA